jgi:hypothetical protein
MIIDILTILALGFVGYVAGSAKESSSAYKLNILLVVLILFSANIHGAYVGVDQFKIYVSAILEGIFGGILIKRLATGHTVQPASA